MNKFDKIKFIVPQNCIVMDGNSFYQKEPYLLKIEKREEERKVVVEVSSKILLDDYPQMICRENIREILAKINDIGVCQMNIDRVMTDAEVIKCDITKNISFDDIEGVSDMDSLKSLVRLSVNNFQRWNIKNYRGRGNGLIVENTTSTSKYHRRIVFYDKHHELGLKRNRAFLTACYNGDRVRDYFQNKVRIETNLYVPSQIKKYFGLSDTYLNSVLNCENNPLQSIMREMFQPLNVTQRRITARDNDRINTLKMYNWDLRAVETHIREYCNNRNVTANMQPYRELFAMHNHLSRPIDICSLVS